MGNNDFEFVMGDLEFSFERQISAKEQESDIISDLAPAYADYTSAYAYD